MNRKYNEFKLINIESPKIMINNDQISIDDLIQ